MYYEINVAKQQIRKNYPGKPEITYKHFFATAPRSIQSEHELKSMLVLFKKLFPFPDYSISASYHPEIGETIVIDTLLSENTTDTNN